MMSDLPLPLSAMVGAPSMELPQLTISPDATSLNPPPPKEGDKKPEEKKPVKKRRSWGQELPIPKTNLPPRKRAKTEDEKEQRRIERVLRNRAAAQTSRERKRMEVERLENEKKRFEQQNAFLLQRLAQMEAENSRLTRQVEQLSAEIRGSRGTTPKSNVVDDSNSPTLTPTLFKQEPEDIGLERIPFPTPSSPSSKPTDLSEASDSTQHPAAMLCDDLQCQSKALTGPLSFLGSTTSNLNWNLTLQMVHMQLLFLTMSSAAYSGLILPLLRILTSLKVGCPLTFSVEEIYQHLPLIHWLISTPSLSAHWMPSSSRRRSVFRMRMLARLLECSPALARPLRDATGKALQLAVRENLSRHRNDRRAVDDDVHVGPRWESLITMAWAIDSVRRRPAMRRMRKQRYRSSLERRSGSASL